MYEGPSAVQILDFEYIQLLFDCKVKLGVWYFLLN